MPDQDNVSMEKLGGLSSTDFAEDLGGNDFGIKDTQIVASNELNKFLLSDPDEVKNIADEKAKEQAAAQAKAKQEAQSQETPEEKQTREAAEKAAKEQKPDGKKALEELLYGKGEEEETKQQADTTPGKPDKTGEEDETYVTLGKDLLRLGVFSKNSEDETEETLNLKSPQEFLERFQLEKKKGAISILDSFLSQFGEDYRKMFDAVFVNGAKPQEYLQSFAKIEALSKIDLTTEENQERVVRAYYKGLKWDDAKIDTRITKLKDYGDLEDEAKSQHEILITKEKEQAEAIEKAKADEIAKNKEKDIAAKKSYQRILAEKLKTQDFDGLPITQADVDATIEYMSDKKYKLASGELLSEYDKDLLELNRPENHELKVKMGLLLRKKLDLTSVKKATISKKSDALFTLSTKNAKDSKKEKQEMKSFF